MSQSALPMLGARRDQMFPTMTQADIDRLRRFGESPPPPFLSSTSRAEALEPGLPCLIPRFLCESAHGCHRSEETDIIGTSRRSSVTLER